MVRKRGFTLIELLVVIAVIAVIAAILFPVFAQAREQARAASCLSNIKQVGTAMLLYVQDYDEQLLPWLVLTGLRGQPGATDPVVRFQGRRVWTQLLEPYLRNTQVLFCPSFNERILMESGALPRCDGPQFRNLFPMRSYYSHFGLATGYYSGECTAARPRVRDAANNPLDSRRPWLALSDVVRPAETAVLNDNYTGWNALDGLSSAFGCEGQSRHRLGCNYLFLDGHAKLLSPDTNYEPTMPCPGAPLPETGQPVANCICAQYRTYDY